MKVYTKTGDKGQTSIIGGRVDKDDLRVEAYGTVDEVNGTVGMVISELDEVIFADLQKELLNIQHELFDCGGDLAYKKEKSSYKLQEEMITFLEERIDAYTAEVPDLQRFILPGGARAAALLHNARTIVRRAERRTVTLSKETEVMPPLPQQYLNRLSDYFFAAARVVNYRLNYDDVEYERSANVFHLDHE